MTDNPIAMVVTDLDGTLLNSSGQLSPGNYNTLHLLAGARVIRVVATGRSLWSALKVLEPDTPLDYLVFASGAGIVNWPARKLLHSQHLTRQQALSAAAVLRGHQCDFMLHQPVPDNHRFWYHRSNEYNPDFDHRIQRNEPHAVPWPSGELTAQAFSQLLVVQPPDRLGVNQSLLSEALAHLNVIRTTSPLDHRSYWFEIFPTQVSKASGIEWLVTHHGLDAGGVLVIGNDFNDLQMLEWAQRARVVANAPAELRQRFETVPDNNADGFSVAVQHWLATMDYSLSQPPVA